MNWLDTDPCPRLIATDQLAVLWMNAPAREFLDRGDHLSFQDGRLAARDADHWRLLSEMAARCSEEGASVCLGCDDIHILVRAHPIQIEGRGNFVGLRIHRTGDDLSYRYLNLAAAFALTRSEVALVHHLAAGLSAELVANELSISVETARSHIRNIYRKVGADCRELLFRRLRPFLEI